MRRALSPGWLRILATIAIFTWLFIHIDIGDVWGHVREADARWIGLSVALSVSQRILRSMNWGQLLRGFGVSAPLLQLQVLRLYFVGGFLGAMVPSNVTADAIRVLLAKRLLGERLSSLAATAFLLNAFTWCAACVVGLAGLFLLASQGKLPGFLSKTAILLVASVAIVVIAYLLVRTHRKHVVPWMRRWRTSFYPLRRFLRGLFAGLMVLERSKSRLPPIFLVALGGQVISAQSLSLLALGMGIDLPFGAYVVAVPLTALVALVPASVLGFGAMQAFHVYFFREFGAAQSVALAMSALGTVIAVGVHLVIGAGILLFSDMGWSSIRAGKGN